MSISTQEEAVAIVNRWRHKETGLSVYSTKAVFNRTTFCGHLPIEVAYPKCGTLGVIVDIYLNAATDEFIGQSEAQDLTERAEKLVKSSLNKTKLTGK